jgi:phage baseplate assembly protein W
MDKGGIFGRGIAFPPRIAGDGRVAWSEGETNVREAIQIILMTELRERVMQPDFGGSLGEFLFEPNTVTTRHLIKDRIARALLQWEPRISVEAVDVAEDSQDAQGAVATITYKLLATQTLESISLNVTLAG